MKILYRTNGLFVVLLDKKDDMLRAAFLKKRTAIWVFKYGEGAGEGGFELDELDSRSHYIAVLLLHIKSDKSDKPKVLVDLVGGCRLIGGEGSRLPVSTCSTRPILGRQMEISRFFVHSERKLKEDESTEIIKMLILGIEIFLFENRYTRVYATVRSSLYDLLFDMGVVMEQIGTPQRHGGKAFFPVCIYGKDAESVPEMMSSVA